MTAHLDHDAAEGRVGPAHDGDAEAGAGPGYLHVRDLPLQYRESGDACNEWWRYVEVTVLLIKLIEREMHRLIKSLITFVVYTFIKLEKY